MLLVARTTQRNSESDYFLSSVFRTLGRDWLISTSSTVPLGVVDYIFLMTAKTICDCFRSERFQSSTHNFSSRVSLLNIPRGRLVIVLSFMSLWKDKYVRPYWFLASIFCDFSRINLCSKHLACYLHLVQSIRTVDNSVSHTSPPDLPSYMFPPNG